MLDDMLPLEPRCGADGVSARFNQMQRDTNPYLEEPKTSRCVYVETATLKPVRPSRASGTVVRW